MADRWAIWSEVTPEGDVRDYSGRPLAVEKLPRAAELSGDGLWATVYRSVRGRAVVVATYINLGPEKVEVRRRGRRR